MAGVKKVTPSYKVKNLSIYFDDVNEQYVLQAEYEVVKDDGKHIESIEVPLCLREDGPIIHYSPYYSGGLSTVNFGFGDIECSNYTLMDELVEPRVEKMTVAEIEKELGYKVEIVSEKKKEKE